MKKPKGFQWGLHTSQISSWYPRSSIKVSVIGSNMVPPNGSTTLCSNLIGLGALTPLPGVVSFGLHSLLALRGCHADGLCHSTEGRSQNWTRSERLIWRGLQAKTTPVGTASLMIFVWKHPFWIFPVLGDQTLSYRVYSQFSQNSSHRVHPSSQNGCGPFGLMLPEQNSSWLPAYRISEAIPFHNKLSQHPKWIVSYLKMERFWGPWKICHCCS